MSYRNSSIYKSSKLFRCSTAAERLFSKCIFKLSEVSDHCPKFHTHLYKHMLCYSYTTQNKDGSRRTSEIVINVCCIIFMLCAADIQ
jgi:hypothetical protein